mgnify:CR=1 FL=1
MTTIKLKCELKPIESCDECPFIQWNDVLDYGESMGYAEGYCGLTNDFIGYSYDYPDDKLDSCPIIDILEEDP